MPRPLTFATATAVQEAFYTALAQADLATLIGLWADDEDVVCIHPGGERLVGLHAIRQSFEELLAHGPVHIRARSVHVVDSATTSIHSLVETLQVNTDEGSRQVSVFATNVYVKTVSGWQMLLHHATPGRMVEPAPFEAPVGKLH